MLIFCLLTPECSLFEDRECLFLLIISFVTGIYWTFNKYVLNKFNECIRLQGSIMNKINKAPVLMELAFEGWGRGRE